MLQPIVHHLNRLNIVLASGSQRREQMLRNIGLDFVVEPSNFDESLPYKNYSTPKLYATETARHKAMQVAYNTKIIQEQSPHIIISADTVVVLDENEVVGKPKDTEEAISILKKLNGKTHTVCTAVAFYHRKSTKDEFQKNFFSEETKVKMTRMTNDMIRAYVDTGEPMDKAGAYAIQGIGGTMIENITGDYYNVVGFPLHKFCHEVHNLHKNNELFPFSI